MPEIDGFEMADMIRQHPRFQKTAIIFISAVHLTDLDRLKGYQRGAVDYISVPVVPELLRAKVSVFAELHRKSQQLEVLNRELRRLSGSLIATQDEERAASRGNCTTAWGRTSRWSRSCCKIHEDSGSVSSMKKVPPSRRRSMAATKSRATCDF
jgi:DNA-binding response OmpR family regulator